MAGKMYKKDMITKLHVRKDRKYKDVSFSVIDDFRILKYYASVRK